MSDEKTTDLTVPQGDELAQVGRMVHSALEKGVDAEGIKALAETFKDFADRDARQQFNRAFARFTDACPQPRKTAKSHHARYTPLDELQRVCGPHLRDNGFSWWWDGTPEGRDLFKTTFVLEHEAGHSKRSHFTLPISTRAGMGEQEKYASAYKWGKRITFMSGLGLEDTDEDATPMSRISESQAADLEALIEETRADRGRFLKYARVSDTSEILTENYDQLCRDLRNMEKKRGGS